jgi:NAD(P)-dependent dehydrogenase (short-subunit alcohol dehydrogenase family)
VRSLAGTVAVVTGAGQGIGRAEAIALAGQGAAVLVNDLPGGGADQVAEAIRRRGGMAVVSEADVSDWAACGALVDQAVDQLGGLDVVVANAGIVRRGRIDEIGEHDLDALYGVLLKGPTALLHHAFRWWGDEQGAGRGRPRTAVTTSSSAGVPGGVEEFGLYGAIKAAVAALTVTAALEMYAKDVTVNAICPHAATRMDAFAKDLPFDKAQELDDRSPLSTGHVGNFVAWLASPAARHLTGQVFEVGGGTVRHWLPWSAGAECPSTPEALSAALASVGSKPVGRSIPRGVAS